MEREAERTGCTSASEYIRRLIREAQELRAQSALEERLLESLSSGASEEVAREDWQALQAELRRKLKERAPTPAVGDARPAEGLPPAFAPELLLEEADGMLDFAVAARRHFFQEQHPRASAVEIEAMLAAWLAETSAGDVTPGYSRSDPRRLQKFLDEWAPKRGAASSR